MCTGCPFLDSCSTSKEPILRNCAPAQTEAVELKVALPPGKQGRKSGEC